MFAPSINVDLASLQQSEETAEPKKKVASKGRTSARKPAADAEKKS